MILHAHYAQEAYLYDKTGKEVIHFADEETKNGSVYEICEAMNCIRDGVGECRHVPHNDTLKCAEWFERIYEKKPL